MFIYTCLFIQLSHAAHYDKHKTNKKCYKKRHVISSPINSPIINNCGLFSASVCDLDGYPELALGMRSVVVHIDICIEEIVVSVVQEHIQFAVFPGRDVSYSGIAVIDCHCLRIKRIVRLVPEFYLCADPQFVDHKRAVVMAKARYMKVGKAS